ncbi:MAG: T9SS type A sorting domain-containing protein, partial [Bacteroidales bacterium]|nr:T9SS type A sorting domain-containing protein [Bacteroidales bacterium]
GNLVIDLSELKSGIYFVKINTHEGNIVKRIIKN